MEPNKIVWKPYQKIAFRILAPFFILMSVPLTLDWYKHAFRVDWLHPHCRDFYDIVLIHNVFVKPSLEGWWGIGNYVNWGIHLLIAAIIGIVWTLLDRKRDNYINLYKWTRLIVRYRIAIGVIGFSCEKMFPTQMPYPSLANLITDSVISTATKYSGSRSVLYRGISFSGALWNCFPVYYCCSDVQQPGAPYLPVRYY